MLKSESIFRNSRIHFGKVHKRVAFIATLTRVLTILPSPEAVGFPVVSAKDCAANPFKIEFLEKQDLGLADYQTLEERLHQVDLNPLLMRLWNDFGRSPHSAYDKFYGRCTRGLFQSFYDPLSAQQPTRSIVPINGGGRDCIVCSVPCCKQYPALMDDQIRALQDVGFKGTYIAYKGALPTPTGEEPRLAGVPYAWKVFAVRDALDLGFERVLWLDAALYPLKAIDPLFDELSRTGFVAYTVPANRWKWGLETIRVPFERGWARHIFPETRGVIQRFTGVDPLTERHFIAACFGVHRDHPCTQPFIDHFYDLARAGTPFLSELPEEFVIGAMLGEAEFQPWKRQLARQAAEHRFFLDIVDGDPPQAWERARRLGCLFFWRKHVHPDNTGCQMTSSS